MKKALAGGQATLTIKSNTDFVISLIFPQFSSHALAKIVPATVIAAKIPDCFDGNKRMAEACGMKLLKVLKDDRIINGNPVDVNVYLRVL